MNEPTEMELRVAEAIRKVEWEFDCQSGKTELLAYARAAIRAMREPTQGMIEAAEATGNYGGFSDSGAIEPDNFDPLECYQAMVDAALSPEDGK